MKIGAVTVGETYAAHDSPNQRYSGVLPREVECLEIVTVEEKVYRSFSSPGVKKIRRVKVKFLDEPTYPSSSWKFSIASAEKDAVKVIEARFIIGPWSDIADDVKKTRSDEAERVAAQEALDARLAALGLKDSHARVDTFRRGKRLYADLSIYGPADVEKILTLAEKGKAA